MGKPQINGIPVQVGDIVSYEPGNAGALEAITGPGTYVQGWSPCGKFIYLGWAGIVDPADCQWVTEIASTKTAKIYKPPTNNEWNKAISYGLMEDAIARGLKINPALAEEKILALA